MYIIQFYVSSHKVVPSGSYTASLPFYMTICEDHFQDQSRCLVAFCLILSMAWNLVTLNSDFSFGKSQKSPKTKISCYLGSQAWALGRGAVMCVMGCVAKKLCTRCEEQVGALSWWSIQSALDHSYGHFLLNISLCQQRTVI